MQENAFPNGISSAAIYGTTGAKPEKPISDLARRPYNLTNEDLAEMNQVPPSAIAADPGVLKAKARIKDRQLALRRDAENYIKGLLSNTQDELAKLEVSGAQALLTDVVKKETNLPEARKSIARMAFFKGLEQLAQSALAVLPEQINEIERGDAALYESYRALTDAKWLAKLRYVDAKRNGEDA